MSLTVDELDERHQFADLWAAVRRAMPCGEQLPGTPDRSCLESLAVLSGLGWDDADLAANPTLRRSLPAVTRHLGAVARARLRTLAAAGARPMPAASPVETNRVAAARLALQADPAGEQLREDARRAMPWASAEQIDVAAHLELRRGRASDARVSSRFGHRPDVLEVDRFRAAQVARREAWQASVSREVSP